MNLGFSEIILILIVLLLFIGPDKLPETARSLGKYYAELQRYRRMLEEEFRKGLEEAEKPVKEALAPVKELADEMKLDNRKNGAGEQ